MVYMASYGRILIQHQLSCFFKVNPFRDFIWHASGQVDRIPGTTRNQAVEDNLRSWEQILFMLKHNLMAAQERQKSQHEKIAH
jgi:hypothetical protein